VKVQLKILVITPIIAVSVGGVKKDYGHLENYNNKEIKFKK
jgi:hypothetical protein